MLRLAIEITGTGEQIRELLADVFETIKMATVPGMSGIMSVGTAGGEYSIVEAGERDYDWLSKIAGSVVKEFYDDPLPFAAPYDDFAGPYDDEPGPEEYGLAFRDDWDVYPTEDSDVYAAELDDLEMM